MTILLFAKSNKLAFYFQGDGYSPNMELKGLNRIAKIDKAYLYLRDKNLISIINTWFRNCIIR